MKYFTLVFRLHKQCVILTRREVALPLTDLVCVWVCVTVWVYSTLKPSSWQSSSFLNTLVILSFDCPFKKIQKACAFLRTSYVGGFFVFVYFYFSNLFQELLFNSDTRVTPKLKRRVCEVINQLWVTVFFSTFLKLEQPSLIKLRWFTHDTFTCCLVTSQCLFAFLRGHNQILKAEVYLFAN